MERFDKLNSYFLEKERKRLDALAKDNPGGLPEMSAAEIKLSCLENNGYENPSLNDKLYLHFRGYKKIANLGPYSSCKAIWLDSNGLDTIEGLDDLVQLRCLYMSKNLITHINGLSSLKDLIILDLSYNRLSHLTNLSCCSSLQTINLARNCLATPDSIAHLIDCPSLHNVDVTNNKLEADEGFMDVFQRIPNLKALSCNGNELSRLPHFRKRLVTLCPMLGYLDRPIDERERFVAAAFVSGGPEAEKVAIEGWREEQYRKKKEEMEESKRYREEQRAIREEIRAKAAAEKAAREALVAQAIADGTYVPPPPPTEEEEARARVLEECGGGTDMYPRPANIREMTGEELEEYHRDLAKARADERRVLGLGVEAVAARYWKLSEGEDGLNLRRRGLDPLEEAQRQLLEEQDEAEGKRKSLTDSEIVQEPEVGDEIDQAKAEEQKRLQQQQEKEEKERQEKEQQEREQQDKEQQEKERIAREQQQQRDQEQRAAAKALEEEQRRRDLMVAESFALFKQQQAAEEAAIAAKATRASGLSGPGAGSGTWETATAIGMSTGTAAISSSNHDEHNMSMQVLAGDMSSQTQGLGLGPGSAQGPGPVSPKALPLYWSEAMDLALAKQVRACLFDFPAIARVLTAQAVAGSLGHSGERAVQAMVASAASSGAEVVGSGEEEDQSMSLLTAEACRVRWAELDAEQWSQGQSDSSLAPATYQVYVQTSDLGPGGVQPDFQTLASKVSGSMPKYLTVPTAFPSVNDMDEDDEMDNEDEREQEEVKLEMR